jgi:RNA polymerase sigma-70 factor, ECF subfamily
LEVTDSQLLEQARRGDDRAFGTLMQRHADRLHSLALGLVGNAHDAEDLLQETLMAAYLGLRRYRGEASLKTWLSRIMLNQSARHHRRMRLRRTVSLDPPPGLEGATPPSLAQAPATSAADARLDLAELLQQLSEEHRRVLMLRELEGLSYEEMARVLDLPRGTIESRLFRARQALRDLLESDRRAAED